MLKKEHTCFLSVPKLVYTISGYQREKKFKFTPHKLPDFSHFLDKSAKNICRESAHWEIIIVKVNNQIRITLTILYFRSIKALHIFDMCYSGCSFDHGIHRKTLQRSFQSKRKIIYGMKFCHVRTEK